MIQALLLLALSQPSPPSTPGPHQAGAALATQGRFAEAAPLLEQACRAPAAPERNLACYQWGRSLFYLKRHEEALAAYALAEQFGVFTPLMYLARAQSLDALGRRKEADYDYRHALATSALRPAESANIQLSYGNFLARQGEHAAAIWQFDQALRKDPADARLWREKARSLLALGQTAEAKAVLEQALDQGQRSRETLLLLGRIYQRLGQPDLAKSLIDEASTLP